MNNITKCRILAKEIRVIEARIIGINKRGDRLCLLVNGGNYKELMKQAEAMRCEKEVLNELISMIGERIFKLLLEE